MTARVGPDAEADRAAVAALVRTFFAAFASGPDLDDRVAALRAAFLPGAIVVRTCGTEPVGYDVDAFLEPRRALLAGEIAWQTVARFREWELTGRTDVFGDVAQHFCSYAKEWVEDGVRVTGRGMKTLQFVRTAAGWRISAGAWDDERPGLVLDPAGDADASA
ncbi:protein of unknown function [Jatrophihabitans endophyticus]|uniref:SnoaL-like domain-containing protein n=1 Tax=Jatrophihabitans endophyticus TaxID=1206085 RepID=A0A1M5E0Y0_9ACTN|nr:DUF4440 domain-containing protein [Jatrophihabitans endophyticus]SHF72928.1 protein of unknown function [Jatrophihabitans endophyticus]